MNEIRDDSEKMFGEAFPQGFDEREELDEIRETLLEAQEMALLGTLRVEWPSGAMVCSRSLKKLFGLESEAAIDFQVYDSRILPEDRPAVDAIRRSAMESGAEIYRFECRFRRFDDAIRYFRVWARILRDDAGEVRRLLGTFQDTTEQVLLRKELEASRARYHDYMQYAPNGVLVSDATGRFIDVNPAVSTITGYSREELLEMSVPDLYPPECRHEVKERYEELRRRGLFRDRRHFLRKSGRPGYWEVQIVPLPDGTFLGLAQDLTEQKQARDEALFSEERYRTLFETIMEGFAIHEALFDEEGRMVDYVFLEVNPAFEELTGLKAGEILGRSAREVLGLTLEEHWLDRYGKVLEEGRSLRVRAFAAPLGRWYESLAFPMGDRRFGTLFRDVTEAQRREDELRESRSELERHVGELNKAWSQTIRVLADIVEFRDPYTAGHQRRVAEIAGALCGEMDLDEELAYETVQAAIVHDVGKIQVPSDFLSKPGRLNPREYEIIKKHPQVAAQLLSGIDLPWPLAEIVGQHHERLDGSGYPKGLVGDEILLQARIIAVADVVEAMASHRPYRCALGIDAALSEIEEGAGTRYDARVVAACLRLFRQKGYRLPESGFSV